MAAELLLKPSIGVTGGYDDNVSFSRIEKTGDFRALISPGLDFGYREERLALNSSLQVDILRYLEETELNTENVYFNMGGNYSVWERFQLNADFSYSKDTTLESELLETGVVGRREDRDRLSGGVGVSYLISELSDLSFRYSHATTSYERLGSVDYDYDSLVFSYNRRLENSLDVFTVQPFFGHYKSDINKVDNLGLSLGWAHPFTETVKITAFLGVRYTMTDYTLFRPELILDPRFPPELGFYLLTFREVEISESDWGGVGDIRLDVTGETYSIQVGYNQDLRYSSQADPITVYRLYGNVNKEITRRLYTALASSASMTKSTGQISRTDDRYFSVTPSLTYKIGENHSLRLAYSFDYGYDENVAANKGRDRNRVWFTLNFAFPKNGKTRAS